MRHSMEKWLAEYSKVVIFQDINPQWVSAVCSKISKSPQRGRTLLLITDHIDAYENSDVKEVSRKEMREILELYYMYEFSDRVQIISSGHRFGTLLNYVDTGLLTFDEAIEAFLY